MAERTFKERIADEIRKAQDTSAHLLCPLLDLGY
jgi:hypothetical protein